VTIQRENKKTKPICGMAVRLKSEDLRSHLRTSDDTGFSDDFSICIENILG